MGNFVLLFRTWLTRPLHTVSNIHLLSLLVSILLADLQCSHCFQFRSHRGAGPLEHTWFSRDVDSIKYRDLHLLQRGARLPLETDDGAAAATRPARLPVPRRDLGVHLDANSTSARAEAEALAAFKAITHDPLDALGSWTVSASTNGSDVCSTWAGVTCSPQYPNHVVSLRLPDFQLSGTINSVLLKLSNLPYLQELDLSMNSFSGPIQGDSLANFSHIWRFNLSYNVITGQIPSQVGELVSLRYLEMSSNNLTSWIPGSIGNCSLLKLVGLQDNALDGTIPPSLGRLSSLYLLNLQRNDLWGYIPSELGNCSSLNTFAVTFNFRLGPDVPPELTRLPLQRLFLGRCSFAGSFPLWITNLTSLVTLGLSYNQFVGGIPDTIGQLGLLQQLGLGGNSWGGAVPASIGNCTSLVLVGLESSRLSGDIPWQVGLLLSLESLYLTDNNFTGVVPSSLSNCSVLSSLQLGYNPQLDPQQLPAWLMSLTNLERLYLPSMNWHGKIPEHVIGNLSNLQFFTIDDNTLTGTIPTSFQNCTYLSVLGMYGNMLTGEIPSELGGLSYMSFFGVGLNRLTGTFPEFISNWTQLSSFYVESNSLSGGLEGRINVGQLTQLMSFSASGNNFVGPIPETFANSYILILDLSDNHLSGAIPDSLGNMTGLQELHLGTNQFEGEIPVHLLISDQLVLLDLSFNKLEGNLPVEVGQLSQLTELYLDNNNFSGTLPSSLGNCTKIRILDLSYNQFQGTIPGAAISQMSASLTSLNFSNNLLSGPWPREFDELVAVQTINVSSNDISGSIPLGLGKCFDLKGLDISVNNLTGAIPQDLGSLKLLAFFNASFNDFEGPIPQSGLFNSNRIDPTSFLGNPGLCGSTAIIGLQHQECAVPPRNVSGGHHACNGFNCKRVWVPIATVSSLIVLGVVLVAVGIGSGWHACGERTDNNYGKTGLQNFASHMRISERDVLQAMDDPTGANVIGVGARSIVYKGVLPGGEMFALKKVLPHSNHDDNHHLKTDAGGDYLNRNRDSELVKEAEILAKFRHKNILKVLSFYSSFDLHALILEYMPGGSLHKHLHEMETSDLTWKTRLKIAMGVAQGMAYLHHDFPEPVIHRDLKPSNILLDADLEPKVGDFGISKFVNVRKDGEATASTFCGTIGYMPPEYASVPWVSTKGDVYSYGMVLLELITGQQPTLSEDGVDEYAQDLRTRVLECFHDRTFELLDPSLARESDLDQNTKEQIMLLLRVSLFCTRGTPKSRPSMMDVIGMVRYIMDLGIEPVRRRTVEELTNETDPINWATEDPANEGAEFSSSC